MYNRIAQDAGVVKFGKHNRLKLLSASAETPGVELLKFGETFQMAIPSQAQRWEGVET